MNFGTWISFIHHLYNYKTNDKRPNVNDFEGEIGREIVMERACEKKREREIYIYREREREGVRRGKVRERERERERGE